MTESTVENKELFEKFKNLEMFDFVSYGDLLIERVPGGYIHSRLFEDEDGDTTSASSVFVPYSW
jgi:hypothetical protein